jgi:hypothetical protein
MHTNKKEFYFVIIIYLESIRNQFNKKKKENIYLVFGFFLGDSLIVYLLVDDLAIEYSMLE